MSFVVRSFNGRAIGCFNQTERRRARLVEPVGKKLDPVLILNRQILVMGVRDRVSRCSLDIMAVHVDGHKSCSNRLLMANFRGIRAGAQSAIRRSLSVWNL